MPIRTGRWIGLWSLSDDLCQWLETGLRSAWPDLRIDHAEHTVALTRWQVDMWLLDRLPMQPPAAPTLWLTGPARHSRLLRCGPLLWQLPMPILRHTLVEAVAVVLASQRSAAQ